MFGKEIDKEIEFERDGFHIKCLQHYLCDGSEDGFYEDGEFIGQNLLLRQDAFRKAAGLLPSLEIKGIREKYHLSQKDFSLVLGLGEISINRFETKMVQTRPIDDTIRRSFDDPSWFLMKFESYSNQMSPEKAREVENAICDVIDSKTNLSQDLEKTIRDFYIHYREPSSKNGNKELNYRAIASIAYLANDRGMPLTKTKFAKLLFYCDFVSYRQFESGITGLVYTHNHYGAMPLSFNSVLALPYFEIIEETYTNKAGECCLTDFISAQKVKSLSAKEEKIVSSVLNRFLKTKTSEIVDLMHQEEAYIQTKDGEIIDYSFAKTISIAL